MIELQELSLQRGGKALLEEASLRINPGEHMALVGANGSGKSSLFMLLTAKLHQDQGDCSVPAHWQIAEMKQELDSSQRPAVDYVMDGHRRFRELEAAIGNCQDDHQLAELHAELDLIKAYQIPSDAERLLQGLGFKQGEIQRPVSEFSGGWRIRLNLAQALMCPSDLLLLDEPTNHLDLDASLWLEQWLHRYEGTLLLISHDRDFIDACCNHVVHLERQKLVRYRGNYSAFERQRGERLAQQQQAFEKQQAVRAHMEDFVRRFRAKATKAKQAQSRIKALERMAEIAPAHVDSPFRFRFLEPKKFSDPLLTLSQADLGYGDTAIVRGVNLSIHAGSRIGLLGANGAGKSTLMKSLAGHAQLLKGQRQQGEHFYPGYFHQHQLESLDLRASPILQLQRLRPEAREQEIRNFIGGFDFHGKQAEQSCEHFSGGEKARLALALIVWQQPNLLLLDEPTNHLDLEMCQALTTALQNFEGAVVVISHDRHLLRNTVDELLLVNDGQAEAFDGSLDDYRQWLLDRDKAATPAAAPGEAPAVDKKLARQQAAQQRQQLAPLTKQIKALENRMDKLAAQLAELQQQLGDTSLYESSNKDKLKALLGQQQQLSQENNDTEMQWLDLQEQLESLQDTL